MTFDWAKILGIEIETITAAQASAEIMLALPAGSLVTCWVDV